MVSVSGFMVNLALSNKSRLVKSDEIIIISMSLSLSILPVRAEPKRAIESTLTPYFSRDCFKYAITSSIAVLSIVEPPLSYLVLILSSLLYKQQIYIKFIFQKMNCNYLNYLLTYTLVRKAVIVVSSSKIRQNFCD
jgi:hypothetical protein